MKVPKIGRGKSIDSQKDPYLSKSAPENNSTCSGCGALYQDKRWTHKDDAAVAKGTAGRAVLCPACQKMKDGFAQGFVTLQGGFVAGHKEELLNLVKNKETLASHINPLERIMEIKESADAIEIKTTSEKLAQRIGRVVAKAFSGEVEYKWSDDIKLARVIWTRD